MILYIFLFIIMINLLYNFFIYYHILLIMVLVIPIFLISSIKSLPKLQSTLGLIIYWGYSYIVITVLFNSIDILLMITFYNETIRFITSTDIINFLFY